MQQLPVFVLSAIEPMFRPSRRAAPGIYDSLIYRVRSARASRARAEDVVEDAHACGRRLERVAMWRHPSGDAHGRSRAREGTTSEVCVIKNCC